MWTAGLQIRFADDSDDVESLAALINRVCADAEKGLWLDGAERTNSAEVAAIIRSRELIVASDDGVVVGVVRVQRPMDELGAFGMLVADPARHGHEIGRELVAFAEAWARGLGLRRMQLELLVPRTWTHPVKEFLRSWYTRIGYREVHTAHFDEAYPELQPLLSTACDFLVYHKDLHAPPCDGNER
jgi:GNAT superfamily N-acetyltransferase